MAYIEDDAARFRQRAEKLRMIAAEEANPKNRELLEQVARDYEKLAGDAEAWAKRLKPN